MFLHFCSRIKLLYTTSSLSQLLALANYVLEGVVKSMTILPLSRQYVSRERRSMTCR